MSCLQYFSTNLRSLACDQSRLITFTSTVQFSHLAVIRLEMVISVKIALSLTVLLRPWPLMGCSCQNASGLQTCQVPTV
jgi:hypothetical protein